MKRFVVVIDTQSDFIHPAGALAVAGAEAIVPAAQDFLRSLRPQDTEGVLFTFDTHEPDIYAASPEGAEFPLHCVRGSPGWENVLDPVLVDPAIPVWRLEKGVFDMWAEEGLEVRDARRADGAAIERDRFFDDLRKAGVREVTVIGVAADYCVKWAVEGLLARGFDIVVPEALTRGIVRQIRTVAEEDFAGKTLRILPADTAAEAA